VLCAARRLRTAERDGRRSALDDVDDDGGLRSDDVGRQRHANVRDLGDYDRRGRRPTAHRHRSAPPRRRHGPPTSILDGSRPHRRLRHDRVPVDAELLLDRKRKRSFRRTVVAVDDGVSAAVVGSHDEIDFRYCWTGNGSGFDALSSSSSSSLSAAVVASHNFWALLLLVFPVLTVFGNVLVVLGVYLVGK